MKQSPKEIAIQRAAEAQERRQKDWHYKAIVLLKSFVSTKEKFITEDFRLWAEANGLEQPNEPRVYGSVIVQAQKMNIIKWSKKYREMKMPKSHSCPKKEWKKVQFKSN